MIYIGFNLLNPFSENKFSIVTAKHMCVTKHKTLEIQLSKHQSCLLSFSLRITMNENHSGFMLSVGLFGYIFDVNLYDNRHWDYETKDWVKHE